MRARAVWTPLAAALLAVACSRATAPTVRIAAAANLAEAMAELAPAFRAESGDEVSVSYGATGALDMQIRHGAPFDVFLAADRERPAWLEAEGLAVAGSRRTYARGRLVLVGPKVGADGAEPLRRGAFTHLAIANPDLAPYGTAALEALRGLGVLGPLRDKLVYGESLAQAMQFVDSGAAEFGLVALSQVIDHGSEFWLVPAELHAPIDQDAVLVRDDAGARAFLRFLTGAKGRAILVRFGYAEPD